MVKTKKTVAERLFAFKNGTVDYERIIPLPDKENNVFGSPNQKIGNFTQQKLSSFGGI